MAEWTQEPPTEPGWYWYRANGFLEIWEIYNEDTVQLLPAAEWWPEPIQEPPQ